MFDPNGRYASVEMAVMTDEDGREVTYLKRRIISGREATLGPGEPAVQVPVAAHERLDQIAARVLGRGELFWRLCDANQIDKPSEATLPARLLLPSRFTGAQ